MLAGILPACLLCTCICLHAFLPGTHVVVMNGSTCSLTFRRSAPNRVLGCGLVGGSNPGSFFGPDIEVDR